MLINWVYLGYLMEGVYHTESGSVYEIDSDNQGKKNGHKIGETHCFFYDVLEDVLTSQNINLKRGDIVDSNKKDKLVDLLGDGLELSDEKVIFFFYPEKEKFRIEYSSLVKKDKKDSSGSGELIISKNSEPNTLG